MAGVGGRSRFATERRAKAAELIGNHIPASPIDHEKSRGSMNDISPQARAHAIALEGDAIQPARKFSEGSEVVDAQLSSTRINPLASIHAQPIIATAIAAR
jgi:hypothetical protein